MILVYLFPNFYLILFMLIITDPHCAQYHQKGHPERPQRIMETVRKLQNQKEISLQWAEPLPVDDKILLRAHTANHLTQLTQPIDFDADTPAYPHIAEHARRSVGGALRALEAAQKRESALSLFRPPGHHAERERSMGFCYLNQIAIATFEALSRGFKKVAVYDFDVHHGNGTEAILLGNPACAFFSIHQYPCYPGTGSKNVQNSHNYPVAPGASRENYREALKRAFKDLQHEKPDLIAVSAGFDAYRGDPLSEASLEAEDYYWIGECIRKLDLPHFCVLEGGYSDELPELIFTFLKGLRG